MSWAGYDDWRCHGYTHKCEDCGNTWQDFEGGCTHCYENRKRIELRTACCNAYETTSCDVLVCRKCGMEYPEMIEIEVMELK